MNRNPRALAIGLLAVPILLSGIQRSEADLVDGYRVRRCDGFVIVNSAWNANGKDSDPNDDLTRGSSPAFRTFNNRIDFLNDCTAVRFSWRFPQRGGFSGIRAFNYIGMGYDQTGQKYLAGVMPVRLDRLPADFKVSIKTGVVNVANGNLSINMRAHNTSAETGFVQKAEMHVYENYHGDIPGAPNYASHKAYAGRANINGSDYIMRRSRNSKGQPYYQSWRVKKRKGGTVNLRAHLNWYRTKGPKIVNGFGRMKGSWYLGYVRVGCEVGSGTGFAEFTEVDPTFQ